MEHNKNGVLALIVLFVGLAFLLSVWFIIYGERFKINNNSFKKSTRMSTFLMSYKNILNLLTCIQLSKIVI